MSSKEKELKYHQYKPYKTNMKIAFLLKICIRKNLLIKQITQEKF